MKPSDFLAALGEADSLVALVAKHKSRDDAFDLSSSLDKVRARSTATRSTRPRCGGRAAAPPPPRPAVLFVVAASVLWQ